MSLRVAFTNLANIYLLKVINKNSRKAVKYVKSQRQKHQNEVTDVVLVLLLLTSNIFHIFPFVTIVDFEQANVSWENKTATKPLGIFPCQPNWFNSLYYQTWQQCERHCWRNHYKIMLSEKLVQKSAYLTHFMPMVSLLYPLKTSENWGFSDVFRRYRKKPAAWNGLDKDCVNQSWTITRYFLMISGARERDQWHEMGQAKVFKESRTKNIKFWQKEDSHWFNGKQRKWWW